MADKNNITVPGVSRKYYKELPAELVLALLALTPITIVATLEVFTKFGLVTDLSIADMRRYDEHKPFTFRDACYFAKKGQVDTKRRAREVVEVSSGPRPRNVSLQPRRTLMEVLWASGKDFS
jgi:hypothetical protein